MVARVVLEQGEQRGVLGFGLGPDHLHIEAAATRKVVGQLARYVASALRHHLRLGAPFAPSWIEPTRDQRHLRNRLLYAMGQDQHHGGGRDPLFEATSLPDLLGLRVLGTSIAERVHMHVPKLQRSDLLALLGTPLGEPAPPVDADVPPNLEHLAEAAAAAFALPNLRGRAPETVLARHAAVLAAGAQAPSRALGKLLGIGQRTIQRLRSLPCDERSVHAVRGQLWLRDALAANAIAPVRTTVVTQGSMNRPGSTFPTAADRPTGVVSHPTQPG